MEPKELRIGNLVYNSNNQITEISTLSKYKDIHNCKSFKPIPLTEEWLLKFGYKKVNTLYDTTEVFEKKLSYTIYFRNGVVFFSFGTQEIKYVHQLQNLYFALTGEELTIKD